MNTLSPPALSLWAGELLALPKVLAAPLLKPVIADPFGEGRGAMKRAVAELLGVVKAALDNGATKIGKANANPSQ